MSLCRVTDNRYRLISSVMEEKDVQKNRSLAFS
jgi:hypothetical protein